MRWLADECVAGSLAEDLRSAGHDVDYAAETDRRASDGELLIRAESGRRLLLTEDKDFGELVFRQSRVVPGVVLLRIDPLRPETRSKRLQAAIDQFGEGLFGPVHRHRREPHPIASTTSAELNHSAHCDQMRIET